MRFTRTITILSLFIGLKNWAQNLILNPSFELRSACPNSISDFNLVNNWSNWNASTPDYFNSCVTLANVDVPSNFGGNQVARTGNAYAGIVTQTLTNPVQAFEETIRAAFTTNLVAGQSYTLTFHVNLADNSPYAVNNFKVVFSSGPLVSSPSTQGFPPGNEMELGLGNPYFTNLATWDAISFCYTATGGENAVTIGYGFCFPLSTGQSSFVIGNYPYYFIDDVSLIEDPNCNVALGANELSLEAECHNGQSQFSWRASSFDEIHDFQLQSSTDNVTWKTETILSPHEVLEFGNNYTVRIHRAFAMPEYFRLGMKSGTQTKTWSNVVYLNCPSVNDRFVFPNPTNGKLNLIKTNIDGLQSIIIRNQLGVFIKEIIFEKWDTEIDLSDQPSGTYFLQFNFEQQQEFEKLMIH